MHQPILSVIVVAYNQAHTIRQTLDHIFNQTTDFLIEVIIGEDASPDDDTRAVCQEYVDRYPNVYMLPAAPNKGVLQNFQDCVARCRGKYIAACAGDDWWSNPLKVQMQVEFLEANSDFGVVHTDMDIFDVSADRIIPATLSRCVPEGDVHLELYKYCFLFAPTTMYRRELLNFVDFREYGRRGFLMEDYPMWFDLSRHCKFHYVNCSTVTYRILSGSISHGSDFSKQMRFIEGTQVVQNYFYAKYKPQLTYSLTVVQHRMFYMLCLQYGRYRESFKYIDGIGFNCFVRLILHTYLGAYICGGLLKSDFYKGRKQL